MHVGDRPRAALDAALGEGDLFAHGPQLRVGDSDVLLGDRHAEPEHENSFTIKGLWQRGCKPY
jgi:hypothetical protein